MNQTIQEIQSKLDLLYKRLEIANSEIDKHPTAELVERINLLDSEIDSVIDQLLDAENQDTGN